ncbi:cytochrome P450 [Pseudomassariella vexata]|uniref:Cytochrome P450 n=1 Tax=Pseudomassariella vexata TaxID=1141098 RepID=A0A1Y2DQY5_9PEZI|nr:cytochrome P450 [Pseudomassariella vexata]ORY61698.1 cytochrome P450 [Pseudomassariella vexata]
MDTSFGVLFEHLTAGRFVGAVVIFTVTSFIVDFASKPSYPDSLPRVGHGKGFVASLRDHWSYFTRFQDWMQEGYEKHSKYGRLVVVPSSASRPAKIVIPQSQTTWMLEQPDSVIGTHEAHNDILYSEYNFLGKRLSDDVYHTRVVHKSIARALSALIPGTQEELKDSIDKVFGLDTEQWKSVNVWDSWLSIVPQVTNRMLIGADGHVNRNSALLESMVKFTDCVVQSSFLFCMFPKSLHPIVGPLLTIPNWIHYWRGAKHTLPVIQKRLDDMNKKAAGDPAYHDWLEPEDFITWTIRVARAEGNSFELQPSVIAKRLLPIEFAAIHTTTLTGLNMILDLVSSDLSLGYLEGLREEAARVFKEEGGKWTKNGLSRLYRIDSAIRESQRLSIFATTQVERKVVARSGITNPTQGWHAPYGSSLVLNWQGLHHDPDLHHEPERYDAFRYSNPREEYESRPAEQKDPAEALRLKKMGMVTTSDSHLAFSHGRHACPGRFFVAHELKMAIAYIVMNYDIKHINKKPEVQWMGQTVIPPLQARVEVRRRKGSVSRSYADGNNQDRKAE